MPELRPAADATYTYVDTDAAVSDMLAWMAPADRVAVDLEADSLYHYYEKVCLLQLTVRGRNFILDPLAGADVAPFVAALADKTLILHGCDYDLRMLRGSFDFAPRKRVIDTMIAAQLLGCEKFGLSSLVQEHSGETLSKAGQKSDWSRRPLSQTQLQYAADDTRFLGPLADILLAQLDELGRREWLDEACDAAMATVAIDAPAPDPQREWRIKGVRDLTARQAAFVRELWRWREREAQRADLPPFKILGNDRLLELAVWAEGNPRASLDRGPRLPRHFRRRRLESLRAVIRKARQLDPSDWPEPKLRGARRRERPDKGFPRLRDSIARLAEQLGLPPSVIAPRAAMEEIARKQPTDVDGIQQVGALMSWQAKLIAPAVRAALDG